MAATNLTEKERADVRRAAWEALAGWGNKRADEKVEPWDFQTRMARADELANWMMTGQLPAATKPNE